jgi:signal peptidase I
VKSQNRSSRLEGLLVAITESFLTRRRRRRLARTKAAKRKGPLRDWLEAILSAVGIVLVINQYLVQAYQIPSASMTPTLLVTDRLFVNKLVYGPELVPTALKIGWLWKPQRGDIVIFESPEYLSKGGAFDIIQRIVYMLTLSLVDIDKDESGRPTVHFLVKRIIGAPGDRIRMDRGEVELLMPGASDWVPEGLLKAALGLSYPTERLFSPDQYPVFRDIGIARAFKGAGLALDRDVQERLSTADPRTGYDDRYSLMWSDATKWGLAPDDFQSATEWRHLREGYYIPEGRVFPMGDNRDDSHDARWFGPVSINKVLGKGLFRYWPLRRIGAL